MSTTDPNGTPLPDAPPSPQPAPPQADDQETISVSRAEYDLLQEQLAQAKGAFDTLNPHASRIEKLVRDPHAAELFDNAVKAYEQFEANNRPKVSDEVRPIYDKVSKLEKFVDDYEAARQSELERPQREFMAKYNDWQNSPANNRFFQKLTVDHPELKPRDIQYLAQMAADDNFAPLEAVWKKESWRFVQQGTAAPPTSQRADAGEVGSAPQPNGQGGPTMRERIIELERARRGISA